jgi:CheY-like chemotaxis protein
MKDLVPEILVVDDDPSVGQMLSRYLTLYGFAVHQVLDGQACLNHLEAHSCDLVLLDVNMPGMDGFEALKRMRTRHSRLALPIIMVTGQAETETMLRGFELGANDYITKPFVFSVVLARIRCQLAMHSLGLSKDMALLAAHVLEPGTKVGNYQIEECVGRGGMGSVYRARDLKLGRIVALKTLLPTGEFQDRAAERFRKEASLIARVRHPGVVQIYEFDEVPICYFTMEFVRGRSLNQLLSEGPLAVEEALRIGQAVARALHAAHLQGIIHRDVKPSNVMIDEAGKIRLMDFGTAKVTTSANTAPFSQGPKSHGAVGTPCYMPPEQIDAHEDADERSDIYALGALLYELLSGRPPFTGAPIKVLWSVVHQAPDPLTPLGVPPTVERICLKALAKKKIERYADAAAMAADLARVKRKLFPTVQPQSSSGLTPLATS